MLLRTFKNTFLGLALSCTIPTATAANLANDFSISANPSNGWYFGYRSTIAGTSLTLFSSSILVSGSTGVMQYWRNPAIPYLGVYKNTGSILFDGGEGTRVPGGEAMVHPSDGTVAVPRYVTPSADTYRIVTAVARYGGNNGLTRFTLVVNGSIVFAEDCTLGYAYQPIHTESLTLPGGSLIDLTVDRGDAFLGHDSTGLRAGIYAQSLIESIAASSIETTEGVEFEGSVASVSSSDNSYYSALSDDTTLSATVEAHGTTTVIDPTCIWMNYESRAGRPGLAEEVSFYDFLASQWVSVAGRVAPISDQSATAVVLQNTARFKSGIGLLGAKIRWSPVNDEDPAQDGWLLSLDTLSWEAAH